MDRTPTNVRRVAERAGPAGGGIALDTPRKTNRANKPQAISVRFEKKYSFAEVLKKVKGAAGNIPEDIKTVKQTRAGNLLMQFAPGSDLDSFKKMLDGKLGIGIEVTKLQQRCDVEIRGIDPSAEKDDILDACRAELGHEAREIKVNVLGVDPRQSKIAVVEGPAVNMDRIINKQRIRIGWTVVTVREMPRLLRCYKCHDIGHTANACKVVGDGGSICRKCGTAGHVMKDCTKSPRCRLCVERRLPEEQVGHVAASVRCGVFKEAINENKRRA